MQNFGSLVTNLTEHLTHKPHFQSLRAHPSWSLGFLTLRWTYEAVESSSPKGAEKKIVDCFQENQQQSFRKISWKFILLLYNNYYILESCVPRILGVWFDGPFSLENGGGLEMFQQQRDLSWMNHLKLQQLIQQLLPCQSFRRSPRCGCLLFDVEVEKLMTFPKGSWNQTHFEIQRLTVPAIRPMVQVLSRKRIWSAKIEHIILNELWAKYCSTSSRSCAGHFSWPVHLPLPERMARHGLMNQNV